MKVWTEERISKVFEEIFERISNGESIRKVLKSDTEKYPSSMLFYETIDNNEELAKRLSRAYRGFKDHLTSEMLEIAYNTEEGIVRKDTWKGPEITTGDMTQHRRLKVDAISKVLSFTLPNVGNQNARKHEDDGEVEAEYID